MDFPFEVRASNFKTVFSYVVMVLVESELSYNKLIGTPADRTLIMDTIDSELQSLQRRNRK